MPIQKNGVSITSLSCREKEVLEVSKNNVKAYQKSIPDYFYIRALADTNVYLTSSSGLENLPMLEYSINNDTNFISYSIGQVIHLTAGQKCYFRGNNNQFSQDYNAFVSLRSDNDIAVGGNIMSLLDKTMQLNDLTGKDFCFAYLFEYCSTLKSISSLKLPATILSPNCYMSMCSNNNLKISATNIDNYTMPFRIPNENDATTSTDSLLNMFKNTKGTFTGTPTINTTYYLWKD